ncbi:MAG: C39 family peptidase [Turicibacter sp.]
MKKKWLSVIAICLVSILLVIGYMIYLTSPMPKVDSFVQLYPKIYAIKDENLFETQVKNECSAFSSAYILRHFGIEATGLQVYEEFDFKLPISGYVLPKGILNYFDKLPIQVEMYTGTLETLKSHLVQDVPVVVLVGDRLNWQHYMTVVGYDENLNELYIFDSLKDFDENSDFPGNRTMNTDYFLSMWNNGLPVFNQLYFVFERE